MPRFFASPEAVDREKSRIVLTGEDVRHIRNVLRSSIGDELTVCDGQGSDFAVVIEAFDKESVTTGIVSCAPSRTEPPLDVTLFQCVPKSDKMDYIIQKCVELGIRRIIPVISSRVVVRFDSAKDRAAKTARWQRICLEAAKQCSRGIVPPVEQPLSFEEALKASSDSSIRIIPYEEEKDSSLREYLRKAPAGKASIYIGPEGGFSGDEVKAAVREGIMPVTLGPRILRTETAGMAVLSVLMYERGDLG